MGRTQREREKETVIIIGLPLSLLFFFISGDNVVLYSMLHVPPLCNTPTVFFCKFYYWEVGKGERPKLFSNFSLEKCYRETLNKKKRCDNNDLIWIILPGTVSSSFSNGAWEKKLPADWDESDTIDWLFTVANKLGIPCEYFASFSHLRGNEQKRMEIFKKNSDFQSTIKKNYFLYRSQFSGNEQGRFPIKVSQSRPQILRGFQAARPSDSNPTTATTQSGHHRKQRNWSLGSAKYVDDK